MVSEDNQLKIICTYFWDFVFGPVVQTFSRRSHNIEENKVDIMAADLLAIYRSIQKTFNEIHIKIQLAFIKVSWKYSAKCVPPCPALYQPVTMVFL